jgi:hypothetical protein
MERIMTRKGALIELAIVTAGVLLALSFELRASGAGLSAAACQTAEITGAFGYMDYEEVRRFAGLYDLQSKYMSFRDEAISNVRRI